MNKVVIQPGVGILLLGSLIPTSLTGRGSVLVARLHGATGARDTTFQPGFDATFVIGDVLVQPNGNLVFAGLGRVIGGQYCNVWGTLPDGALNPAFAPLPGAIMADGLAPDPATGNIYLAAAVVGAGLDREPVRLFPNGVRDPAFSTTGTFVAGSRVGGILSIAVQPNGRLLLGGPVPTTPGSYAGSGRLLPNGTRDPSYQAGNGPTGGYGARKVLVQPDGALLFCGDFDQAAGFSLNCLARMLDPNVLDAGKQESESGTAAWPVPAHNVLHLRLASAATAPLRVTLLDVLGRQVRQQEVAAGQNDLTLPTAGLPPGAYLLRVAYPTGRVLRRVVLE